MLHKLRSYTDLIQAVASFEHRLDGTLEQYKAVAHLVDGSRLHINEVWLDSTLTKYAYYWLSPANDIIQGWDNAPHHADIPTYPHHTHIPPDVQSSSVRSLDDVLTELVQRILDA